MVRADTAAVVRPYKGEISTAKASSLAATLPAANHQYGISLERIDVSLLPQQGDRPATLRCELEMASERVVRNIGVGMPVRTPYGLLVSMLAPSVTNYVIKALNGCCTCIIECSDVTRYLAGGEYAVDIWLSRPKVEFLVKVDNAALITVPPVDVYGTGAYYMAEAHGLAPLPARFDVVESPPAVDPRSRGTRRRIRSS